MFNIDFHFGDIWSMSKKVMGYEIDKYLGEGACGIVRLGKKVSDGTYVALKIHRKDDAELTEKDIQAFE